MLSQGWRKELNQLGAGLPEQGSALGTGHQRHSQTHPSLGGGSGETRWGLSGGNGPGDRQPGRGWVAKAELLAARVLGSQLGQAP